MCDNFSCCVNRNYDIVISSKTSFASIKDKDGHPQVIMMKMKTEKANSFKVLNTKCGV